MIPMRETFLGLVAFFVFWLWLFNADAALHSKPCAYLRVAFKVGWRLSKAALAICLFAVVGIILLMAAASALQGQTEAGPRLAGFRQAALADESGAALASAVARVSASTTC